VVFFAVRYVLSDRLLEPRHNERYKIIYLAHKKIYPTMPRPANRKIQDNDI